MADTQKTNTNALVAFIFGVVGFFGLAPIAWPIAGAVGKAASEDFVLHGDAAGGGEWMANFARVLGWVWAGFVAIGIVLIYRTLWF